MSFTTTNMSALPIWGSDLSPEEAAIARAAGWSRADIAWEGLMEQGNRLWCDGRHAEAKRHFRRAHWLATLLLPRNDPRRATAAVNLAIVAPNPRMLVKATRHWDKTATQAVANMQIRPRARSSLFHLRMEALHRDTYHDNMRTRIGRIADETRETLIALADHRPPPHRHYARWRGERPTVFDDTRKILGACLLIIDA